MTENAGTTTNGRAASPVAEIRHGLERMRPEIQKVLPEHVTSEKFERTTLTAIQRNPDLLNAERRSLFGACLDAATDGLMPDGREGAIVTFKGKAQWMPMVAGILKKVRQSGEIKSLSAHVVHENDEFDYMLGDDEKIYHKPAMTDRGKIVAAYAIAELRDGFRVREVMTVEDIERVRKVGRSGNSGPWSQWYGEMARKTVIRRLSKRLPMSTDLEVIYREDQEAAETQLIERNPPAEHKAPRRGGVVYKQATPAQAPGPERDEIHEGQPQGDDDWQPPTAEEMAEAEARAREAAEAAAQDDEASAEREIAEKGLFKTNG